MSFVSTYNSASIRGWSSGTAVGANLILDFTLGPPPPIANNINFGAKISMSSDGNVISINGGSGAILYYTTSAISANIDMPRINANGNVWIGYVDANIGNVTRRAIEVREASANWTVTSYAYPTIPVSPDNFGAINTIDGTGNIIVAFGGTTGGSPFNTLYTFVKSGNTYVETQTTSLLGPYYPALTGPSFPVSVSDDANILAVGCSFSGSTGVLGYIDIYNKTGNTYVYQTRITAGDITPDDGFGETTSLNSDGSLLLVGAENQSTNTGAAYLFQRTGSSWSQIQKIISPKATANDYFGTSVYISSDSTAAVIGAVFEDTGGNNRGSAFVYFNIDNRFYYSQELTGAANGDGFGYSVATSNEPNFVTTVGAFGVDSGNRTNVGRAYVYSST